MDPTTDDPPTITRREYLHAEALRALAGPEWADMRIAWVDIMMAKEAVASTAIEHPEWDMDERKTWAEWIAND